MPTADNPEIPASEMELDPKSANMLARLERTRAGGKRRYIGLIGVLNPLGVILVTSLYLWLFGNPYWTIIIYLSPLYLAMGVGMALFTWKRLPARIEDLRAGRIKKIPRDINEALWLALAGAFAAIFAWIGRNFVVLMAMLDPSGNPMIRVEWIAMLSIAGMVVSIWGAIKCSRAVRKTPVAERNFTSSRGLAVVVWLIALVSLGAGYYTFSVKEAAPLVLPPTVVPPPAPPIPVNSSGKP